MATITRAYGKDGTMDHQMSRGGDTMPLSMASVGEEVTLVEFHGGHRFRKRLADLGLNLGMTVRVVQRDPAGPMILAVKNDSRLAIGRGIAHKILVQLTTNDPIHTPRGLTHGRRKFYHRSRR